MASIVKRGKTYSVIYYEGEGKEKHQVWDSGLNYTAAKARKAQIELEQANNTHINQKNILVSEFLYEFIEKYGEKKWAASTYDGNVGLLENYVHPYMGDKKLISIRTKTVDDYYHFLLNEAEPAMNQGKPRRERIAPSTIHDIHKVLRGAFNQAVKWEYIAKNPFINASLPEYKEKKRPSLTPSQLHQVLEFTDRSEYYDHFVIHCAIQLAFACSMRGGEVGGVQWERYDMEKQMLYIDRVIDRVDKKLLEKLSKMEVIYQFPNLFHGTRTAIICQANGRPLMTEHLNKRFKDILVEMNDPDINVRDIVFHSIRHTSAGVKLRLSERDIKAVQGDGGWNTPDMVTKRYAHILDEDRKTLADKMETSFYGAGKENKPKQDLAQDMQALFELAKNDPDLLKKIMQSIHLANK